MSFWVGPRAASRGRPPAPGMAAPGSSAPGVRAFPKQKGHSGSADDLQDDGLGLYPPKRRGRRGTVQGAPPAPAKAAPKRPAPGRRASRFVKTPPLNAVPETRPMSASAIRRAAPPPITKAMKKEVRRKSGLTIMDDLSDEEDSDTLPTGLGAKKKKKKSSMFRTNTDTVWTDEDLEELHDGMREEFEKLTSLSNSVDANRQSGLHQSKSMSLSMDPATTPKVVGPRLTTDSADTLVNDSPMVTDPNEITPRSLQGEEMLTSDTQSSDILKVESVRKFISTDSDMTVYDSVDFAAKHSRTSDAGAPEIDKKRSVRDGIDDEGSPGMEKKRSVRDGIENAPMAQQEKRRTSMQVDSQVMHL